MSANTRKTQHRKKVVAAHPELDPASDLETTTATAVVDPPADDSSTITDDKLDALRRAATVTRRRLIAVVAQYVGNPTAVSEADLTEAMEKLADFESVLAREQQRAADSKLLAAKKLEYVALEEEGRTVGEENQKLLVERDELQARLPVVQRLQYASFVRRNTIGVKLSMLENTIAALEAAVAEQVL